MVANDVIGNSSCGNSVLKSRKTFYMSQSIRKCHVLSCSSEFFQAVPWVKNLSNIICTFKLCDEYGKKKHTSSVIMKMIGQEFCLKERKKKNKKKDSSLKNNNNSC